MLRYNQAMGEITRDGVLLGSGYSGRGDGRNNPQMQSVRSVGPIPCGRYQIGPAYDTKSMGPLAIPLTPIDHDALGRSGFFIHGDNKTSDASHGCIILTRALRVLISELRKQEEEIEVFSGIPEPIDFVEYPLDEAEGGRSGVQETI